MQIILHKIGQPFVQDYLHYKSSLEIVLCNITFSLDDNVS